ncbi:ribosome biogenesis GTP-binding protein YihA/YsxC [Guggenheimella bovis]
MKIREATFLGSFPSLDKCPKELLPEIALAGRSNVGKSSLLNMLLNRKNFARTSSTPGKTQLLNFYEINKSFRFVDLPGYGYAKVSKEKLKSWGKSIEEYLLQRECILDIFLLLDIRREPSEEDLQMYHFIKSEGYRGTIVITKADKLTQSELARYKNRIVDYLGAESENVFITSSTKQRGKYPLWDHINRLFEEHDLDIVVERQEKE